MKTSLFFSSKSPHWPTPKALLTELNEEFHFDFDPCPLGESEVDGSAPLFTRWSGRRVFCNPPYNNGIYRFLERGIEADVAVFLLPARTDTKWFHDMVLPHAHEIRFIKGRLCFGDPDDLSKRAPFPSMLVIYHRLSHGVDSTTAST